jgi:hypothetical protein
LLRRGRLAETRPVVADVISMPLAWAMADCSFFVTAGRQAFTAVWAASCACARPPTQMAHANADAIIRVCGMAAVLPRDDVLLTRRPCRTGLDQRPRRATLKTA